MRYLFVFLTFVISFNSIAQSKKEQIAILTNRLDSLNKEYIKDTTYLSNTVETIDREYTIISMQYEEAQELIKKKSAAIYEKTNTIKTLNGKNMELMEDLKELRLSLNSMELENKHIKQSLDSMRKIYPMVNRYLGTETNGTECSWGNECLVRLNSTNEAVTGIIYGSSSDGRSLEHNYVNGLQNGSHKWFFKDGSLECEAIYVNGKLDGITRGWYENGQLEYVTYYKNGSEISSMKWNEDGTLKK